MKSIFIILLSVYRNISNKTLNTLNMVDSFYKILKDGCILFDYIVFHVNSAQIRSNSLQHHSTHQQKEVSQSSNLYTYLDSNSWVFISTRSIHTLTNYHQIIRNLSVTWSSIRPDHTIKSRQPPNKYGKSSISSILKQFLRIKQ